MYQIDFQKKAHIYFMGIGGISMSGFAELLHEEGFTVSGSDQKETTLTTHLEQLGITVKYGQCKENITSDIDLVVYTAAISKTNEEFIAAQEAGIPMIDRAEMVGQVMKNYSRAIAISGTHGKTTTTSMVSHIFLAAQLDPTISVGGILKAINGNLRVGKSENFITEACEYTNSFLKFHPTISLILNIEEDHMDFFKDLADIRHSFQQFTNLLPDNGLLVINGDITNHEEITAQCKAKILTYSTANENCNYHAANISYDSLGKGGFDVIENGNNIGHVQLAVVGEHNISNALSAIALARSLHLDMTVIQEGLAAFTGTDRRFQYKGELSGITIIDDYAHHPTEITATLEAAKKYPHKNTWCVFQPHTYTRTKAFLDDFAKALSKADKVVLADIYAAREVDPGDISSADIMEKIKELGTEAYYFPTFDEIENFLLKNCVKGDLLITMGAGDVVKIGESLLGL
ncbi:MAG: UDP-N-acetylmuramate--L-alanine ligase [Lachnospiraceae bacterium]|nr:UDP-N-acetylmuramate--L-alanine ligase [Lachnospiraceae bacterium]